MSDEYLWDIYPDIVNGREPPFVLLIPTPEDEDHVHFAFVEDVEEVEEPAALEAPDASTMVGKHPVFRNQAVRFRTSGPDARMFLDAVAGFDQLDADNITDAQRQKRRAQLREFFKKVPLPIIDIYVSKFDADYKAIKQTLLPGSWTLVVFRDGALEAGLRPVIYGAPEFQPAERIRYARLRSLAAVTPPVELRLRDIFSFNHIRDADISTEDDGSATPQPKPQPMPGLDAANPWKQTHRQEDYAQKAVQYQKLTQG